jgi:hypothetical protein
LLLSIKAVHKKKTQEAIYPRKVVMSTTTTIDRMLSLSLSQPEGNMRNQLLRFFFKQEKKKMNAILKSLDIVTKCLFSPFH